MLFAKVGVGQTFTLDPSSKAYPSVNCDQTTFLFFNNTVNPIWYKIYVSSDDGTTGWTDITTAFTPQRVNAGIQIPINVVNDGYYKIYYSTNNTVNLSSLSLASIRTTIKESPTITSQVSNLDIQTCLNIAPNNLSVTASAGSGTISQYAWYSNTLNSNTGGTSTITNITSSTLDNYIPGYFVTGELYYYPVVSNSYGCSTVGNQSGKITVNALPVAGTITGSNTVCVGLTTSLNTGTITGGSETYSSTTWASSALSKGTINATGVVTGVAGGSTNITYTVTDSKGCISPSSSPFGVTVNAIPSAPTITSNTPICEGATLTFSSTAVSGGTFSWTGVNGFISSLQNPTRTLATTTSTGNYSATVTVNGCTSPSSTISATVNPLPAKPTLTSSTICEGQTTNVSMSLPAGTYTYTWIVPTGVATSTTKTISTSKAGTYSLTITDANSCTSDIGTGTVTVNTLPTKPTLTSATICDGETATVTMLTPTGTNTYTYTWTVPTGVVTSTTKTVSTNKAGTYSLTITDVNSCTSEVGTGTVTVNPLPTLTITNPAAVCAPGTIDLTATTITAGSTASLTYTYFTNATATNTLTNTSLIGASGTYYIKGTSTLNCSAIQPVNTIINPIPSFNILSPSVCVGSVFTINVNPISGTSSDFNYTWVVPTGVANPGNVSNFTTTIPGVYTATIKNKSTNCESAALNNTVTFYPLPTAAAIVASDNKVMEGATLNLTAAASGGTGAYLYTWVPNSTTNYTISGGSNALFNALREGTVNIKYQVKDANNCSTQSADFVITITPATIIFEIPNAFTPNGDGMNDELKIISNAGVRSLTSFKIFSRSGNLVFESRDLSRGWDGRYNGNLLPADIYYWTAVYVDRNNVTNPKNGTVLLLK